MGGWGGADAIGAHLAHAVPHLHHVQLPRGRPAAVIAMSAGDTHQRLHLLFFWGEAGAYRPPSGAQLRMEVALPGLHTGLPHPLAAPGPHSGSILHAASKRAEHGGRCCQCLPGCPAGLPSSLQAPGMRLHSAPAAPRSRSCPCPGLRMATARAPMTTQRPSSSSPKGRPQAQPRGALQPGLYAKAACRVWAGAHAKAPGSADAGAGVGLGHVWSAEGGWGSGVKEGPGSGACSPALPARQRLTSVATKL